MSDIAWTDFPCRNVQMQAPPDWDPETQGECGTLPVYADGTNVVSCWKPSWRQRLALLFGQRIWLRVVGRQPPVMLSVEKHDRFSILMSRAELFNSLPPEPMIDQLEDKS